RPLRRGRAPLRRRRCSRRHLRGGVRPRRACLQARGRRARGPQARDARRRVRLGGLLLGQTQRLATVTAIEPTEVLRIDTEALVGLLESEPLEGGHVMERFATMIQREFTLPALLAQVRRLSGPLTEEMSSLSLTLYRLSLWLRSPRPYLMLVGFALFLGFW